jgi:EAL domain-containing protein (putative c-di-GMP-specific phosphodiesterase class I)
MRTSSSSPAASRLLLRSPATEAHSRYRTRVHGGRHSPAGLQRQRWLGRLRRALREGSFAVHYQPIVALSDGGVTHYEALVRLDDVLGASPLAPARFLPAAERYGLIRDIDRLVLERVARLLDGAVSTAAPPGAAPGDRGAGGARGVFSPGVQIAINLSALSVTDETMLMRIERCLRCHELDPARLVFELTETAAISNMARARAFCAGVRRLGCQVALDDFGTGFGSLQYLRRLPFDYLKIDGSFVRSLAGSSEDQLVVAALARLATDMGKRTIAECVSDLETLGVLRELGVDYAQGYALGRPQPLAGARAD